MNVYLPAPSMSPIDRGPTAAEITAIAGAEVAEPFTARQDARTAAETALQALTDNRPGGTAWKAAVDADTAVVAAGKPATALAKLINGDAQRYGQALATIAVHQQIANTLRDRLDRPLLEAAISTAKAEAKVEWANLANQAWSARANHAETWRLYRQGHQELARWRSADQLAAWLEGRRPHDQRDTASWHREDQLPDNKYARGAWLCVELIIDPSTKWWNLPKAEDVEWPLDGWPLVEKAIQPSAVHAVHGGAEVTYQPAGSNTTKTGADRLAWDLGISA